MNNWEISLNGPMDTHGGGNSFQDVLGEHLIPKDGGNPLPPPLTGGTAGLDD